MISPLSDVDSSMCGNATECLSGVAWWRACVPRRCIAALPRSTAQGRRCHHPRPLVKGPCRRVLQVRAQQAEHGPDAVVGAARPDHRVVVECLVPGDAGRLQVAHLQLPFGQAAAVPYPSVTVDALPDLVRLLHRLDGARHVTEPVTYLADVVVEGGRIVRAERPAA